MATAIKSTQRTAQVAAASNYAGITTDGRYESGSIQFALIDVTMTTSETATSTIDLIELPVGAIVLPELSYIIVDDAFGATALTLDVGDAVDPDRYADGVDVLALGKKSFIDSTTVPAGLTTRHECVNTGTASTTTTLVIATVASSTTPAAGTFKVTLAYKCH